MSLAIALALMALQPEPRPASCQAALGTIHDGVDEESLPGRVDGSTLDRGRLLALRRQRGDALISVVGGNFAGADFRGERLHNICFVGTDLRGSDWRGAHAPGAAFVRANLEGANLSGARLERILLRDANLKDARAEGAVLAGGLFDGGWFEGSVENLRLDRADLSGFRFDCGITLGDGCPVYTGGAEMSLRGANLTGASLFMGDYAGARVDRTEIGLGNLEPLSRAEIAGPVLLRAGDARVELAPHEFRSLVALLRPRRGDGEAAPPTPARPAEWLRPGARALFVEAPLAFVDSLPAHPLYRRLLPVLIGASYSRVAVRVNPDGSVDAAGEAIGANAHMCSLAADRLRLDRSSGWHVGAQAASDEDPPQWRGRPMPVLRFTGDRALINSGARFPGGEGEGDPRPSEFVSCGVRAAFAEEMVRVPASDFEIDALLETLRAE